MLWLQNDILQIKPHLLFVTPRLLYLRFFWEIYDLKYETGWLLRPHCSNIHAFISTVAQHINITHQNMRAHYLLAHENMLDTISPINHRLHLEHCLTLSKALSVTIMIFVLAWPQGVFFKLKSIFRKQRDVIEIRGVLLVFYKSFKGVLIML